MKNLFLMSVFSLFMMLGLSSPSLTGLTIISSAAASSDDGSTTENSSDDAFHCPEGISTCYKADGLEYTDVNNLTHTTAGTEGGEGGEAILSVSVVKPSHFRSF